MDLHTNFKRAVMLAAVSVTCFLSFAQNHTVTGTVKDAAGELLIGVSVQEKGTTNGTVTDFNGKYTITATDRATLVFSYIGYNTQEVSAAGKTVLNVTLEENNEQLEEVVVIGYGTVKRRDLTGSVASVTGEVLQANPVSNVMQALQGQLPGVNVTSQDGRPGATMSVRVRGGGSITQSNEPLYVVDGVQVSSINDIPADNIESIDVLKDAATTAIYGARGANGVILVTTKAAREGKPQVKYGVYYQVKNNSKILETMDAYDYVLWDWSYATAYGATYGDNVAKYFGLGSKYGNHLNEYRDITAHNYINDVMRTAHTWNHDLSLSGGNASTKYYATINYSDDEGIRIKSNFTRYNANFKIDQQISKKLSFGADLRYSQMLTDGTNFDMATSVFVYRPVDIPLGQDNSGLFGNGSDNVDKSKNPLDRIDNFTNIAKRERLTGRGALTWLPIKGLTAKSEISLNRNWSTSKFWDAGNPAVSSYSEARLTQSDGYGIRWANTLNYEIQGIGKDHSASVLLGNELLSSNSNESVINGFGYPKGFTMDEAFGMIRMTGNNPGSIGKNAFNYTVGTPSHTLSYFTRANYSYKGRYLLTATFRADGSSKFAPDHRWGYFPAAAAAWRISDEDFLKETQWLDNLKLRLSFGSSGADNISPSLWKETWVMGTVLVDGENVTVYRPGNMKENKDLKWEPTISRNLGVDYGFFKNKIRGSIDLYWNSTQNILMPVPIDPTTGYTYQFQNVGQTSNKGIEFALGASILRSKDWRVDVNLTYNYNHNNVDKLLDGVNVNTHTGWGSAMKRPYEDYVVKVGQPVGLIMGFKSAGFYTTNDFNYDAATGVYTLKEGVPDINGLTNYASDALKGFKRPDGQNAFPGMIKFADTDKSGFVNEDDATIIGKAMAEHTGGLTINAGYKNIDFSVGFVYQIGGKIYNANAMRSMMGDKDAGLGNNRMAFIKDTYRIYDTDANGDLQLITDPAALDALNTNAKYPLNYNEYGLVMSQFVEDASYLRLQNLTIGYSLPQKALKNIGISNIRIYFTGSNLFCLTGYSGLDPDVNTSPGGVNGFPTPNYDYNAYPKARSYTFGLNVTF